jgi:hypothetical protein
MFIFEKVGHSKFVEMYGDTSDFFSIRFQIQSVFLAPLAKGNVSFCHHLASEKNKSKVCLVKSSCNQHFP